MLTLHDKIKHYSVGFFSGKTNRIRFSTSEDPYSRCVLYNAVETGLFSQPSDLVIYEPLSIHAHAPWGITVSNYERKVVLDDISFSWHHSDVSVYLFIVDINLRNYFMILVSIDFLLHLNCYNNSCAMRDLRVGLISISTNKHTSVVLPKRAILNDVFICS